MVEKKAGSRAKAEEKDKDKVLAVEVEVEKEDVAEVVAEVEPALPRPPALSQPPMGRVTSRPEIPLPPPPPAALTPPPSGPAPVVTEEFTKPEPVQGEDAEASAAAAEHSIVSRGMKPQVAAAKGTLIGGAIPPGRPG